MMKIKLKNGKVVEVEKAEGVILIASGQGERVHDEPEPQAEKKEKSTKVKG